jgi:hypothetical protein
MDTELLEVISEMDLPENVIEIVFSVYEMIMSDSSEDVISINVYSDAGVTSKEEFMEKITGKKGTLKADAVMKKIKLLKFVGINFNDETGKLVIDKEKARKRIGMLRALGSKLES